MLAAIHLQLRARQGLLPAYNSTFQYLVNWWVSLSLDADSMVTTVQVESLVPWG